MRAPAKPPVVPDKEPSADKGLAPEDEAKKSWFYREPLALKVGKRFTFRFYGDVQADFIYDTTRSYGDTIGSGLVARKDTYEGTIGRFQASSRSTKFGISVDGGTIGGISPAAVIEADFAGDQPSSNVG